MLSIIWSLYSRCHHEYACFLHDSSYQVTLQFGGGEGEGEEEEGGGGSLPSSQNTLKNQQKNYSLSLTYFGISKKKRHFLVPEGILGRRT